MKQALLLYGSKQTPVAVEETADGGLIVQMHNQELFRLQPVLSESSPELNRRAGGPATEVAFADIAAVKGRKPVMSDFNGDPAHDWPLWVRRFHETQPLLVMDIAADYKKAGYSTPSIENILRAGDDLIELQPILSEIIAPDGRIRYGAQSAIARQLGIKNAGVTYRKRIEAVLNLLLENYVAFLEETGAMLEVSRPKVEASAPKAASSATSTTFQKPPKAVNQ